jgi:hypothetical protein
MYASAFKNCGITSFTAGKHFTRIPENAFYNVTTLVSVDLSACMKMDIIYNYAFKNCSNLETVKLPVDKSETERAMLDLVGTECFYRCSTLANINIEAIRGVTSNEPATVDGSIVYISAS